jgi:hypothetical protein
MRLSLVLFWATAGPWLRAQAPCSNTPAYSPCELVFELNAPDAAAHPHPYLTVEIKAEFRSPRQRTFLLPAYWDGGSRMIIRFTPTEAGQWDYRVSGNIRQFDGQQGSFTAAASEAPGFIRPANVHHWAYTEGNRPHFWMGAAELRFGALGDDDFRAMADARAKQKFTHIRGRLLGGPEDHAFTSADAPDLAWFQRLDRRIRYLNEKGMGADLILAGGEDQLVKLFPAWEQRRRFIRFVAGRYAAMNVTWQGVEDFESYSDGRVLLKEIGGLLKEMDPYQHPRTTGALMTSAPLLEDGWMNFAAYGTGDDQLCAIEHQLYPVPGVSLEFAREDSGAGKSGPQDVDSDTFRHRLWNAAMDGQYVTYANTGSGARYLDSPGAKQMTVFFDFFADTRHWELEPYFDVDGGRALALEDSDYIVYVEKPAGPIELLVEKHGYDVTWINPATGEEVPQKKFKGEHFTGEAPDRSHDWILRVAREGRIEGMNRSYKFESREIVLQEVEVNSQKVPFEIEQPSGDLSLSRPAPYAAKIKRETRATRSMMWLWTGESAADNQGYRVLAIGQKGSMRPPAGIAKNYPAVLHLRLLGMNANGKVYALDRTCQLNQ